MILKTLLFCPALFCTFIAMNLSAQTSAQVYKTVEGSVGIIGAYKGEKILASSHHLFARINYQTAEIELQLDPLTLRTQTDLLNAKLLNSNVGLATLKGKMNIPYVNTLSHPPHNLKFEAEFQLNGVVKKIMITGLLKHISSGGNYSCLLTLDFKICLKDFGVTVPGGYSDEISIAVSQAVLKPDNQ
ncbi:MAG: hypothetical protein HYU69_00285 [Bacteroidetes bacterium]|nr:hypothetical protein [Bacteroidota bacterium]